MRLPLRAALVMTVGATLAIPAIPASAQTPKVVMSNITTQPAPAYDDGDGDELLEHWGDPHYAREQRLQLGGLLVFFAATTALSRRRQAQVRRFYRHGRS